MHEDKNRERAARQWAHDEFYFGEKPGTQPFVENTVDSRDSQRFVSNDKGSHGVYSECLTHGCKSYINQLDSDCGFFSNAETDVQLEGARKASVLPSVVGNFDDHSIEKENWSNKIDTEAKFYGKREHPGSKINTKFTSWLQDVPHYRSITSQQLRSQEISQWSDHYVENGQQKKIKSKGLDETYIDDPCKLNESLNKIQDTQDHASPNDIQEPHAHVSKSNINEHIILQPALYLRPEACTKFDGNHFNRPMRMPASKDLNSGVTTNQVNENPAAESRGFSEFENSAMHPSEPPREEHKIPDSKLTRWQASHWNKVCADMPVWGSQGIDEIPSAGTALGHILISKDDAVANKSGLKHISSKQRDDNLDNERRVRSRVEQLGGIGESVKFIRPGHSRTIRPTSGKDRHSKVNTSKGPRDRRVRLSVPTAVQFYDVQDRLGYDQPSKAVEWLMKNAKAAIDELWQLPFTASTESPSKTSLADSSLHESSHDQLSSTSASFNNTLTPPAPPSVLRSISQFERECNQSIVIQECGAQSRNEKSDSKQIITGTSIGENDEHTTEHLNSNVHAELNNKSKGEAKKPAEENHVMIISRDNTTRCKTDSTSATASFGGHQLHQSPPRLNASYFYTRDIQPSLINYSAAQEPAHPWHVILNKTDHHQERSKGLETLSQSHTYKPIQGAYPQYFDYSYAKLHQSAEEAIIQNSFYKAANNSQVSTGFEKHGTVSANIFSDSKNNMCSCTTTSTRVLSSYRDDNAMFRTPSTSQFCPVTNSAARTPAMHYVSDRTFKHPTVNTLLPSNPSTLSSAGTSFSLKQKVYLEGLIQQQDHVTRSPNWLSGILDQNTFLNLPSRINTISSSIFAPYSTNNFAEDVTAIPGTLSSSKESNSFTHIGHNVLQSSEDTCPSHLILRSQIPARIQGFDELPDVMERAPQ